MIKKRKGFEAGSSQMLFLLGVEKRPVRASGQRDIWGHKGQNSDSMFFEVTRANSPVSQVPISGSLGPQTPGMLQTPEAPALSPAPAPRRLGPGHPVCAAQLKCPPKVEEVFVLIKAISRLGRKR